MEFKSIKAHSGSYIQLLIKGGDNCNNIGDQVWFSDDGLEMEISESCDEDVIDEVVELFSGNSKRAFKGAMMRMGVL